VIRRIGGRLRERSHAMQWSRVSGKWSALENVPGKFPLGPDVVGLWGLLEVQLHRDN